MFNILSLNAGGLLCKTRRPEFLECINKYDLICFQESKFDYSDTFDFPGYKLLPLMIRKKAKSRSGGIAILIKEKFYDNVKILKNDGENFIGLQFTTYFHIIFCFVLLIYPLRVVIMVILNFLTL